jgi:pyruvate,orthophosphate dikinase
MGTTIPDTELRLLQAIRLKGRLSEEAAATRVGPGSNDLLERFVALDMITVGSLGAKLTSTGRERLTDLLDLERRTVDLESLSRLYEEFGAPNAALKAIVTAWQVRADGSPNDHSDPDHDAEVIARLLQAGSDATPLVERIAETVPRLDTYPTRLGEALQRVGAGEHKWFANPMIDSYHQVWFELHEELIGVLGLVREDEAKSGRA